MPKIRPVHFAFAILAVAAAGCSRSDQTQKIQTQTSGELTVQFTIQDWPPHSGDNTAVITVMSNGQPVNDANVVATANMRAPKLDGSPASGRFEGSGQYDAPLRFVATTYDIDVKVVRLNRPAVDVSFPLEAQQ
jgi:hypothetical protein